MSGFCGLASELVIVLVVLDVEFCMGTQVRAADDLVVGVGRYGGCR